PPAPPIVSPPKAFRSRSSSCSSTNACAARSPIAASTTVPTPSTSRPANSKPPTTAPTKPSNRSSIYSPPDLSAAIVELFLSTILPRRIYYRPPLVPGGLCPSPLARFLNGDTACSFWGTSSYIGLDNQGTDLAS